MASSDIEFQVPSKDPADDDSLGGAFRSIFKKLMQGVDGMLPATVVSYDRAANVAVVRPSVMLLTTEGKTLPRAAIASVRVLALGGGGMVATFPIKAGDRGWIEASDRDISLFMQAVDGGRDNDAQPNTLRLHSFSDGRFIPDIFSKYVLPEDADADADMVISTVDGTQAVIIKPASVKVVGTAVDVETTGDINVKAGGTIYLNGASVVINGIPFETHKHPGVTIGTADTLEPIA